MSNYKLGEYTAKESKTPCLYDVYVPDGTIAFTLPDVAVEDPRFGWEKVEEPFKEGEWVHVPASKNHLECLFRFNGINNEYFSCGEYYVLGPDGSFNYSGSVSNCLCHIGDASKADPEQIERILSIVARHKGYKEGVQVEDLLSKERTHIFDEQFVYEDDMLFAGDSPFSAIIYSKGTWAEILPKETETVDWRKKEAFSYEDISKSDEMRLGGKVYYLIPDEGLEEEAKKRVKA